MSDAFTAVAGSMFMAGPTSATAFRSCADTVRNSAQIARALDRLGSPHCLTIEQPGARGKLVIEDVAAADRAVLPTPAFLMCCATPALIAPSAPGCWR